MQFAVCTAAQCARPEMPCAKSILGRMHSLLALALGELVL